MLHVLTYVRRQELWQSSVRYVLLALWCWVIPSLSSLCPVCVSSAVDGGRGVPALPPCVCWCVEGSGSADGGGAC